MSQVHETARGTPRTRDEVKESTATLVDLAERYNISKVTAPKRKNRDSPEGPPHRPYKLNSTLSPAQGAIGVELRCMALLLDDLNAVVPDWPRRSKSEPPCRSNIEPGLVADQMLVSSG